MGIPELYDWSIRFTNNSNDEVHEDHEKNEALENKDYKCKSDDMGWMKVLFFSSFFVYFVYIESHVRIKDGEVSECRSKSCVCHR